MAQSSSVFRREFRTRIGSGLIFGCQAARRRPRLRHAACISLALSNFVAYADVLPLMGKRPANASLKHGSCFAGLRPELERAHTQNVARHLFYRGLEIASPKNHPKKEPKDLNGRDISELKYR